MICENVLIKNTVSEGEVYPLIFLKNSTLTLTNSVVSYRDFPLSDQIYISDNSSLNVDSSTIYTRLHGIDSNITINDTYMENFKSNSVHLVNSELKASRSTFNGGKDLEKRYLATIKINNSVLETSHCTILYPGQ